MLSDISLNDCPTYTEGKMCFAGKRDNVIFATTRHGGHLGYFECKTDGNLFVPDTITWLDKIIVQYSDAIVNTMGNPEATNNHGDKDHCAEKEKLADQGVFMANGDGLKERKCMISSGIENGIQHAGYANVDNCVKVE